MTNARILAGRLADLLRVEHGAMADFLVALADFDRRRAWVELGYSRLLCRFHNNLAARSAFGDEMMNPFTRGFAGDGASQPDTEDPPA